MKLALFLRMSIFLLLESIKGHKKLPYFFHTKDAVKVCINSLIALVEINMSSVLWELFQTGSS